MKTRIAAVTEVVKTRANETYEAYPDERRNSKENINHLMCYNFESIESAMQKDSSAGTLAALLNMAEFCILAAAAIENSQLTDGSRSVVH